MPEINIDNLSNILSRFEKLLKLNKEVKEVINRKKELNKKLKKADEIKIEWIKKYKSELSKHPQCPTCKQKLDSKTIREIKL